MNEYEQEASFYFLAFTSYAYAFRNSIDYHRITDVAWNGDPHSSGILRLRNWMIVPLGEP
jgi:hypothetical protein